MTNVGADEAWTATAVPDRLAAATMTRLRAEAAPAVITITWSGIIVEAGPGADAILGGDGAMVGQSFYDVVAPDEREAIHQLLVETTIGTGDDGPGFAEMLLTGRRADGLPLVARVSSGSVAVEPPNDDVPDGRLTLVIERWGGPCTWTEDETPPTPVRTGPDHVLSHDARGAIRNTRNFAAIFARKLHVNGTEGPAIPGADGEPLPLGILETGLKSAATADEMLKRIVWFLRLENDPIVMTRIPVGTLIESSRTKAGELVAELAEMPGFEDLSGPIDVQLGAIDADLSIVGNIDLLSWSLAELFVNSRKFAGPSTIVTIDASQDDSWAHLAVTNTGATMNPDLADAAFDLGRMLQGRGERPGVGMGLPLCRRIITRHGGRIAVVSSDAATENPDLAESGGTTLGIRLPADASLSLR